MKKIQIFKFETFETFESTAHLEEQCSSDCHKGLLVGSMQISALCSSTFVSVFTFILIDAESSSSIQFVATRTDALEAAVGVLASARWWANTLNPKKT